MMLITLLGAALASDYAVEPGQDTSELLPNLQPGDTVTFQAGDHVITGADGWLWSISGTAGSPIVIKAADGARFLVQNDEGFPSDAALVLDACNWLTVEGFEIEGADDGATGSYSAIKVQDSNDIILRDLRLRDIPTHGVVARGDNRRLTISDSRIRDLVNGHGIVMGCWDAACFVQDAIVRENWIHDIQNDGNGILLLHGSDGANIVDNVIYGVGGGGIYLPSTNNSTAANSADANAIWSAKWGIAALGTSVVRNNVIFNTIESGLMSYDPGVGDFGQVIISHNTIANTGGWGVYIDNWQGATGNVLANNAIVNPVGLSVYMADSDENDEDYPWEGHYIQTNLLAGWTNALKDYEGHYITGAGFTDFIDVEGWNFYPNLSSALIDQADVSGEAYPPTYDFNGIPRNGSAAEIGAYEWDGAINPGWPVQEGFKTFDLNYEKEDQVLGGGCCSDGESSSGAYLLLPLVLLTGLLRRRED